MKKFGLKKLEVKFRHGLGVIDKIHFAMKECLPIEQLIPRILNLID